MIDFNPKPVVHKRVLQGMLIARAPAKSEQKPVEQSPNKAKPVINQTPPEKTRVSKPKTVQKAVKKKAMKEDRAELTDKKKPEIANKPSPQVKQKPPALINKSQATPAQTNTPEDTPTVSENVTTNAVIPPRIDAALGNNPSPPYPRISRRLKEQGTVLLEIYILANGQVGEMRIKQSSGYRRLDQAARAAVAKWRYQPAQKNGRSIAYWYVQPIYFSLNDTTRF
ncbi:MAG: energy transducer TonB [Pseudomonadota bacterium]|nr:energy transducer TonB [Pseudomonadota bacterium]